jgi:hypothetical protein
MKTLILILAVFSAATVNAQWWNEITREDWNFISSAEYQVFDYNEYYKDRVVEKGLLHETTKKYRVKKNGDKKLTRWSNEKKYDKDGRILMQGYFAKDGTYRTKQEYTYYKNDDLKKYCNTGKKNKLKGLTIIEYDKEGNKVSSVSYKKDSEKVDFKWIAEYKPLKDGLEIKQINYGKKNGTKTTDYWIYKFDLNDERKETLRYKRTGKLMHKWSYSCDDEGKLVDKDTTEVCILTEYANDGSWAVVTMGTMKKGTYKDVKRYDKDSNLVEFAYYYPESDLEYKYKKKYNEENKLIEDAFYKGKKEKLRRVDVCKYKGDNLLEESLFKGKKKKLSHKHVYTYDGDKRVQDDYFKGKNGEQRTSTHFEYDENGNLAKHERVNSKKGSIESKTIYQNNDHGDVVLKQIYNKKDRLHYIHESQFEYLR